MKFVVAWWSHSIYHGLVF